MNIYSDPTTYKFNDLVACETSRNPCFVYESNSEYNAVCKEVPFSDPPEATCGACPEGFTGNGASCEGKSTGNACMKLKL